MRILTTRIIGNDLIPRHSSGAQYLALTYIVNNEKPAIGIDTTFVVNRIKNKEAEKEIIDFLEKKEQSYRVIPFGTEGPADDGVELNQVRNQIIKEGRDGYYHWTFPLDGRCFIPEDSYPQLKAQCAAFSERHYAYMPQHRLKKYKEVADNLKENFYAFSEKQKSGAIVRNEYTLGFSIHAKDIFNEKLQFGQADKAEMLLVAGIPGPWINWTDAEFAKGSPVRIEVGNDEFAATHPPQYSGYALILPSGNPEADGGIEARLMARQEGLENLKNPS